MSIEKLKRLAKKHNAEIVERPNGHIQIKGKLLVNYYPYSKNQSAYIAGTHKRVLHVTPEKAIAMAFTPPPICPTKKRSYTAAQSKKWKQYLLRKYPFCQWCHAKLDIETATLEHIIPRARGGLDNMNNFVLSCEEHNQERGHDMPELKD